MSLPFIASSFKKLVFNISSTESNVNIAIGKKWVAIDHFMTIWKPDLWLNKMKILPSCSHFSTIVWLHHSEFNETLGEKARWELDKDTACYFEQILEAAAYKTAVIQPLTSHLTNHPTKTSHICWRSKDKLISNIFPWTTTHEHTSVNWLAKTFIYQLCADTKYYYKDLARVMDNRDGWQEIQRNLCC